MITTIKNLDTKTLLAVYNGLTGKSTTKFASRAKGEAQVIGAAKVAGKAELDKLLIALGAIEAPKAEAVPAPKQPKTKESKPRARKGTNLRPVGGAPVPCREGSKQAILLDTLARPEGATMEELIEALSGGARPWVEATVRSGFGWDMKQKGYGVRSEFDANGLERFFIVVPEGYGIPPHRPRKSSKLNMWTGQVEV